MNGTLNYLSASEFPGTEFYVLQTSAEGRVSGDYNTSVSTVFTHLRVVRGAPYIGEGFSLISYSSEFGAGEGWTHDKVLSPTALGFKGLFSNPLYGFASAVLDESETQRRLFIEIRRVDLGLPPSSNLKVRIWGFERVSPGQTTTYTVELRNDGLKSAENVSLVVNLPYLMKYSSDTGDGVYSARSHEVTWRLADVPPKAPRLFTVTGSVEWGLPTGTVVQPVVSVPQKEVEVETDPTVTITDSVLQATQDYLEIVTQVSNQLQTESLHTELHTASIADKIEPIFEYGEQAGEVIVSFEFAVEGTPWTKVWGWIRGLKTAFGIYTTVKDFHDVGVDLEKTEGFLEWLWVNDILAQNDYEGFSRSWEAKSIFEFGAPNILRHVPVFGSYLSKTTEAIMGGMTPIFRRQLYYAVYQYMDSTGRDPPDTLEELYMLYLEGRSYDAESARSRVVVARDPNVKYGPEAYVSAGEVLSYKVECENEGEGIAFGVYITDTLDEDLDDSTLEVGPVISTRDGSVIAAPGSYNPSTRTITWLVGEVGPGEGGFANFSVKVRNDAPQGTEIINFATVYFPSVPETTRTNAIVSVVGQPDIAVTDVRPLESTVEAGASLCINVTVVNEGYLTEEFNLTIYADATPITTKTVTLTGRRNDTVVFVWNTTGFPSGNHTVSAYAWPVPDEAQTEDNLFVDGLVQIKALDDIPPVTVMDIGEPKYVLDGTIYLTSATSIALTAEDNPSGSGVTSTAHRIYNTTYDTGWVTYTQPLYLVGLDDGTYSIGYHSADIAGNVEASQAVALVLDNSPPVLTIETPLEDEALQDRTTLAASGWDLSGVVSVTFSIREPDGDQGRTISPALESMPATLSMQGKWTLVFDTTQLPDGYYLLIANGTDVLGNTDVTIVKFSIRNWAVVELLPASETNKAGRTMPVKFSLRVLSSVDPSQPFVRNEELTIVIFEKRQPENILQTSRYGSTARDYRIDDLYQLYITNFQTLRTPTTYVAQVYRKGMLVGTFEFRTVK